jgi:hypothetical protein
MGLDTIIINAILKSAKSTSKFDVSIDAMLEKFEEACPPKQELIKLIQQKNQMTDALTNVSKSLEGLEKLGTTTSNLLNGLSAAVTVIKAIPIPTSVPPGVGIPVNVLTIYSDVLDALREAINKGKGIVAVIPQSVGIINDLVKKTIEKLGTLDGAFSLCLTEMFEEESEEWSPTTNYEIDSVVTYSGEYYKSLENDNLNNNPSETSGDGDGTTGVGWWESTTKAEEQSKFFTELNFALTEVGDFVDVSLNQLNDQALVAALSPGADPGIWYKGFLCTLEYESDSNYSFPSRRCKGERYMGTQTDSSGALVSTARQTPEVVFNWNGGEFSFTANTQTLLNELFYQIDLLPARRSTIFPRIDLGNTREEAKIGTYWMYEDTSFDGGTVYFEYQGFSIAFQNPEEYFSHRSAYGWPQNWDDIEKRSFPDTSVTGSGLTVSEAQLGTEELSKYSPFGVPGVENKKQVKMRTSMQSSSAANMEYYYQWNPSIESWDIYTPNFDPFGTTGSLNEVKTNNTVDNSIPVVDTYEWDEFYYRWNFISREID